MDCQWMLILFGVLTATATETTFPITIKRCALPMTSVASIGFEIPVGHGDKELYTIKQYIFDELWCHFEGFKGDREAYECKTGNILQTFSWNFGGKVLLSDSGGLICRTNKQPKVMPNAHTRFMCEDTESVLPSVPCKDTGECLLSPMSYKRFVTKFFQNIERSRGLMEPTGDITLIQGEYKLECPTSFDCFWWRCSGLLIIGKDVTGEPKYLGRALEVILKAPAVPTSLEIMDTAESLLPDTICQYESLQQLALANNKIKELPTCICKMFKLKILDASRNSLERIGELNFGSEQEQTFIDLSFNNISDIKQNAFSKMSNLAFLALNNNFLTDINFYLPASIIHLVLSHNNVNILPSFQAILKLQVLYLQHNRIDSTNFYIPKSLKHLDLSSNHIDFVHGAMFKNAENLGTLNLNNNNIKVVQLPWENVPTSSLNNLKTLTLSNNLIENIDESLTRLEEVDLSHNQIESIDLVVLKKANNHKKLLLQYNKIKEIKDSIIFGKREITILPNMSYMNISHNNLKVAPLSLIFLKNLQAIDLSHNIIEKCTFSGMPGEDIYINIDKQIKPLWLGGQRNGLVKNRIDLNFNNIKSFKDVFGSKGVMVHRFSALFNNVHIGHNPFHCDCKMYSYLILLHDRLTQTYRDVADDYTNTDILNTMLMDSRSVQYSNMSYVCETPLELKNRDVFDKDILDKLTCDLLPQEECDFHFKPSASMLTANCSHLNTEKDITLDRIGHLFSEAIKFSESNNIRLPIGLNVKIYMRGMNFSNAGILNSPDGFFAYIALSLLLLQGKVILLDLSHSNISDCQFLKQWSENLPHLTHLFLNDNNLTSLSLEGQILHFQNETHPAQSPAPQWNKVTELHLYNNPWECSCHTKWMKKWLGELILLKILKRPDEIKCASPDMNRGKIVHLLEDEFFCEDPKLTYLGKIVKNIVLSIAGSSIAQSAILILACLLLFLYPHYWGREHPNNMLVQVPPNRDNIVDDDDITDMEFDAFVSYCEADSEWVEQEFIPCLEGHDPPYKICQHKRHFRTGAKIYENEQHAITYSRRTIIIMSNTYLDSTHCMYEFKSAYSHWIVAKDSPRLAVVKFPEVDIDNKNETCSAYFRCFTYLAKDDDTLFDRLFQFMPRNSVGPNVTVNDGTDNANLLLQDEDESIALRHDQEKVDNQDLHLEQLPNEDEMMQMLFEAELEAEQRVAAGEEISPGKIFQQKMDSFARHLRQSDT